MKVTVDITGLDRLTARLRTTPQRLKAQWAKTLVDYGGRMAEYAARTFRSEPYPGTTDTATAVRTGALRRSLTYDVQATAGSLTMRLGYLGHGSEPIKYAALQEYGSGPGGIVPVRGKWLTIPLKAAMTASGVARGPARSFTNTFFTKAKPGPHGDERLLLWQRQAGPRSLSRPRRATGRSGGRRFEVAAVPLFLLVKRVDVPARPALRPTAERFMPELRVALAQASAQAFRVEAPS